MVEYICKTNQCYSTLRIHFVNFLHTIAIKPPYGSSFILISNYFFFKGNIRQHIRDDRHIVRRDFEI